MNTVHHLKSACLRWVLYFLLLVWCQSVSAQRISPLRGEVAIRNSLPAVPENPLPASFPQVNLGGTFQTGIEMSLRTANNCGVTASIAPSGDSVFSTSRPIQITSTSTNATSFQWKVNGNNFGKGPVLDFYPEVGAYDIMLIASNGACRDSVRVQYIYTGEVPSEKRFVSSAYGLEEFRENATCITATLDSGFLLGGTTTYLGPNYGENGLLIKLRETGCVEWSRLLQGAKGGTVSNVLPLRDGGYLVSGAQNYVGYLLKLSALGAPVWQKSYQAGTLPLGYSKAYELSDGSIVAAADLQAGFSVVKLRADGTVLWNKFFQKEKVAEYPVTRGFLQEGQDLYVFGTLKLPDTSALHIGPINSYLMKLSPSDGSVQWARMYQLPGQGGSLFFQGVSRYGELFLFNAIDYTTLGGNSAVQSLHFVDRDGHPVKSQYIRNDLDQLDFPFVATAAALPGGDILLFHKGLKKIPVQPGVLSYAFFLRIDSSSNILWKRHTLKGQLEAYKYAAFNGASIGLAGTVTTILERAYRWSDNMHFLKMDSSGSSGPCIPYEPDLSVVPYTVEHFPFGWAVDSALSLSESPAIVGVHDIYTKIRSICPAYIDSCAVLKVVGEPRVCNLSREFIYRAGKTDKCAQPVEWMTEGPLQVLSKTDSELRVRFPMAGTYKIAALLKNSCNPAKDSLFVQVETKTAFLELGRDTTLCPNTSIRLSAGRQFLAYLWQDGSTDSVYTVKEPGRYWVQVTDSCGNVLRDSIQIDSAVNLAVDAGPDRVKCNRDTLHLRAPAGYLTYEWSPAYNLSQVAPATVVVNPLIDTAYYLRAEQSPGCFAYDTVRVSVHTAPLVQLGPDTSFCQGEELVLDAGDGFKSYHWSTGASSQQIVVREKGTYWVHGLTAEGCPSEDTLRVVAVYANPAVNLGSNTTLCTGGERVLDAGTFRSYLWQDGSTGRTLSIRQLGEYSVRVTDSHGCPGSDTLKVDQLLPLPKDFLPEDTALCSYGTLVLKPTGSFSRYLWNTGAVTPLLSISKPGAYSLEVTDAWGCTGKDEIVVYAKECMQGLYVPTAFTPNRDGKNDLLRAMLLGNVKSYEFSVYNRWGALVYKSADPQQGWDGTFKGKPQDGNVYVWVCSYQLEGEERKQQRGTVLLLR